VAVMSGGLLGCGLSQPKMSSEHTLCAHGPKQEERLNGAVDGWHCNWLTLLLGLTSFESVAELWIPQQWPFGCHCVIVRPLTGSWGGALLHLHPKVPLP
jgi:hypothetical protein